MLQLAAALLLSCTTEHTTVHTTVHTVHAKVHVTMLQCTECTRLYLVHNVEQCIMYRTEICSDLKCIESPQPIPNAIVEHARAETEFEAEVFCSFLAAQCKGIFPTPLHSNAFRGIDSQCPQE